MQNFPLRTAAQPCRRLRKIVWPPAACVNPGSRLDRMPDAELPGLARKVFDGKATERDAIKQMVKDWQADTQRA
jgi:hypothetical protein